MWHNENYQVHNLAKSERRFMDMNICIKQNLHDRIVNTKFTY